MKRLLQAPRTAFEGARGFTCGAALLTSRGTGGLRTSGRTRCASIQASLSAVGMRDFTDVLALSALIAVGAGDISLVTRRAVVAIRKGDVSLVAGNAVVTVGANHIALITGRAVVTVRTSGYSGVTVMKSVVSVGTSGVAVVTVIVVAHTRMTSDTDIAVRACVTLAALVPVAAAIADVDRRTVEVVMAVVIAVTNGIVPRGMSPIDRAEEIAERTVEVVLPIEKNVAQIRIAVIPIVSSAIGGAANTHQVFKIYLVSAVVLFRGEVKFVGHLVGQEPSPFSRFVIAYRPSAGCHAERQKQGQYQSFHNKRILERQNRYFMYVVKRLFLTI